MRDPNRIPIMLQKLERLWTLCPDLRLGQLIDNARHYGNNNTDCFNIEDEALMEGIDKLIEHKESQ